ncbi:MAG: type I polyketide synthase [Xanthobacteraceae bacterium]
MHDEIAVIGWSCRLPGANTISDLWSLLVEGRCAISRVPSDRFPLARYGHPRPNQRGKSYTWAAGVLDDVWGFDPLVFGISPREATQMDPQQRILLQLTWEALEDAGIRPSTLAGSEVGVFVGASQTDYGHAISGDQAMADSHFATGNSLAVIANRISYIYDLHGPSITVDTACSSSLVALHHATEALRSGRIDTAIVGGINVIASPVEFVTFSQASMLSATGLCRAFSADADGYVRAEGGVVVVLRKGVPNAAAIHGLILASDVNSGGRTNGIALPSTKAQAALLTRVYSRAGIDAERLSFVEAHGTGTPVGDPIEAAAIGRSLGRLRSAALPIGSIKTNIGHLEPASGLAGLLKAMLALNHGILPRSLNFREANPNIDFAELNLTVCHEPLLLADSADSCAGVNSFGFGGTNAHVVIAPGRKAEEPAQRRAASHSDFFALSAASRPALVALAQDYCQRLAHLSQQDVAATASAIIHRRQFLADRLVISAQQGSEVKTALDAFIAGAEHPQLQAGTAIGNALPVAFVYSGNGSQWPGMGTAAYRHNAKFRAQFDSIDHYFQEVAGWSLKEALFSDRLGERLTFTRVAQPLIFAIQSATTAALRACGIHPSAVIGHSVGEVAAAEAAGVLDLRTAVEVIHARSTHQEQVRGRGRMAAILAAPELINDLITRIAGLEIAAHNNPRATTVAGTAEAIAELKRIADDRGIAFLDLMLDYPFHTGLMGPIQSELVAALGHIRPNNEAVPFVSTVTGACLPGTRLGAEYWWLNIREPVQFLQGIREAAKLGARFFVELGPRGTLIKHFENSLAGEIDEVVAVSVLDRQDPGHSPGRDPGQDPIAKVAAKALVSGAQIDIAAIFGSDPGGAIALPSYPWQQQQFRFAPTPEAIGLIESERHPFSGARYSRDALEWYSHIDTALFPALADHKVGEHVIFPGTGYIEIALAVARAWLRTEGAQIAACEILKPLDLTNGETREIMSRLSPNSSMLEIFSRPRLSETGWLLHCRCKILRGETHPAIPSVPNITGPRYDTDAIYRVADASGLHYGDAFRLLAGATVLNDTFIKVELASPGTTSDFVLDPIRIDACSHGLLALFGELRAAERGVSYIPVRVDEATLFIAGGVPRRAIIEVLHKSERSILGNYYFFNTEQELLAVLRGVRCQAVQVRRDCALDANAFIASPRRIAGRIVGASGLALGSDAILERARRQGLLLGKTASQSEAELLIEGAATAAAYAIASGLAERGHIDIDALIGGGRLTPELLPWLKRILQYLAVAALATQQGERWQIIADAQMPPPGPVIQDLTAQHPDYAAEIFVLGAMAGIAHRVVTTRALIGPAASLLPTSVLDFHDAASISLRQSSDIVARLLDDDALWPTNRAVRLLLIGHGPLLQSLLAISRKRDIVLAMFEPNRRRFDLAQRVLAKYGSVRLFGSDEIELEKFDFIIVADNLHRLPDSVPLGRLQQLLAPHGALLALQPPSSLFRGLLSGLENATTTDACESVAVNFKHPGEWQEALRGAGFHNVRAESANYGRGAGSLVLAEAAPGATTAAAAISQLPPSDTDPQFTLVFDPRLRTASDLGARFEATLRDRGAIAALTTTLDFADPVPAVIVHILAPDPDPDTAVDQLTMCCLEMKACADRFGSAKATLWFVFKGALADGGGPNNPVASGAWAFSRTLANERQHLDVRRIDIAPAMSNSAAASRLCDIVTSGTAETELQIDNAFVHAVRVNPIGYVLDRIPRRIGGTVRLQRHLGGRERFRWEAVNRAKPGPQDIEIAVAATGLNFRDLMWMLSLLPDDIVEQGGAGPTLGCECAGEVIRVGAEVHHLHPGDRVAAFAAAAFATHVTVAAHQAVKLPDSMGFESAATIPVAFTTAYYALVSQAKLRRREWVLIHGGAGAVGLAAIQIALARKARVIATAGSTAKRDLLKTLGVHYVLDSRATAFVDEVRSITGSGVDVVLNSLAGETMERSIGCLREFGRFVELGKRDYVSNTHIGLRPFRNNISYFGVDLDQLMVNKSGAVRKIYAALMRSFASGRLSPLPYSVFRACDIAEAFHLMQHSGHIGKIVLQPPTAALARPQDRPFAISPTGTHIITGGFGGFGLEAAKWLVERGARHLVLIGRRGATTDKAKAVVAEITARGAQVHCEACDMADRRAVERVFEHIAANMPPVVGILHAAMVLDDGLLSDLDEQRFHRVLEPKVRGVENLDTITSGLALDYFVLFSSAVTLMGNPGQANYVAANAYMEGVARRRRAQGHVALAVGWGPITDVGVMAQSDMLRSRFQRLMGGRGLRAAEALDLMAQALALPPVPELAVITISPTDGVFAADRLPVLKSPTYADFIRSEPIDGETTAGRLDLQHIAKTQGAEAARRVLSGVIVTQLARVLHAREEEISRVRPVGEIGLDSLMALEFAMSLEESFGVPVTLSSSVGSMTVSGLVNEIICQLDLEATPERALVKSLAERHFERAEPHQLEALAELVGDATSRRKGMRS